jgi:drug/metabolite transporter (DMT)-like permease
MADGDESEDAVCEQDRRRNNLVGAGLMILAVICFTGLDTILKYLIVSYDFWILAWARNLVQVLILVAILPALGARKVLTSKRPALQLLRGVCLAGATISILLSLKHMALTQTYVAMLTAPMVAAALSGLVLAERTTGMQWFWIIAGFIGVVVALNPTSPDIGWFLIYAVAMAAALGTYHVVTRLASRVELPFTQLFYVGLIATIALTPTLLLSSGSLSVEAWGWVLLAGGFGTAAHFLLILAISYAPPAIVSPMLYTQIIFAAISGYLVFGEKPTVLMGVGAVIVALSGVGLIRSSNAGRAAK